MTPVSEAGKGVAMGERKLTKAQIETLALVADGKVDQQNCGYSAWRIFGANPSVVGRLASLGLVRWTKAIGGSAELTNAGRSALEASNVS